MPKPRLSILLVTGPSSVGKSFVTEHLLAVDYVVTTAKMDRFYGKALRTAGISPGPDRGIYNIAAEAGKVRDGTYPPDKAKEILGAVERLVHKHLQNAHGMGVSAVFEGYTLRFRDEVEIILRAAREVTGEDATVTRVLLAPERNEWNHFRAMRPRKTVRVRLEASEKRHARAMELPEPVPGVTDRRVENADEVREIADSTLARHKWHQSFSLGPVTTVGPSKTQDKVDLIQTDDVLRKRVVDLCCATGVVAIMLKVRGATEVVGIEMNPRHYCKGLELQKVLARNSELDPIIDLRLGDVRELLPAAGEFDTAVMLGALHYFEDYASMLGLVASAAKSYAYIEFNFSEREHTTEDAPDGVRAYIRQSGNTIYMANRRTVEQLIGAAMPGFVVEARNPVSAPGGRKLVSQREIWRLARTLIPSGSRAPVE